MTVAHTYSAQGAIGGGEIITIEVDIIKSQHAFSIVGLPSKAVEEARDRVSSAIKNSGFPSPKRQNHKVVVSLAPADIKKEGPQYDLPIAMAYLFSSQLVKDDSVRRLFIGELALDGTIRPVRGTLAVVLTAKENGFSEVIVPAESATEAALIDGIAIIPASTLTDVVKHIDVSHEQHQLLDAKPLTTIRSRWSDSATRLEDIRGQESAKRGLLIAAAGRHNILLVGPPGTGKTMLAQALRSILPPLTRNEALEVTMIHSLAGTLAESVSCTPPFRSPHHTASHTSLVGGGTNPKPGEITLAHHGVLFADEFPEFDRRSIDALRQPLEDREITISRVQSTTVFPADFIFVAALNPYRESENGSTDYSAAMRETYKNKISGPILDRIDLWLEVPHVDYQTLTEKNSTKGETEAARSKVLQARKRMHKRLEKYAITTNANMSAKMLHEKISLNPEVEKILRDASTKLNLSPRSLHRVIKVALTIADLDNQSEIKAEHMYEALQYRAQL